MVASNNVIKDNIFSDTHDAIFLWFRDNSGNTIEGNEISASTIGINLLFDNDDNVIRNNTTTNTNGKGITLTGHSSFGSPNGNTVEGNVISTSAGFGLHVQGPGASDNVFRGNNISGGMSDGIALFASNNIAEQNVISGGARAIHISANFSTVRLNEIDGDGLRGMHLQGSFNVVEQNDISAGRITGIFLFFNDNNVVEWNNISGTIVDGILVQGLSGDRKPNDNEIRLNQVLDSVFYGIRLLNGPNANLIEENTVTGSGTFDLFHDGTSTPNAWTDNTCGSESGGDIPAC